MNLVWAEMEDREIRHETELAVLFDCIGCKPIWIPKSELREICYVGGGDSKEIKVGEVVDSVQIPRWLANEKLLSYPIEESDE